MRRRDIEVGEAYALRPRADDRLPTRVEVSEIDTRTVQWIDPTTGRRGRCFFRDLLGP